MMWAVDADGSDDLDHVAAAVRPRMDPETRELGLQRLRELRQQRGWGTRTVARPSDEPQPSGVAEVDPPPVSALSDPAVMALLMAAGAERERLEQRVETLEREVQRLRATLGRALQVLGSAFADDDVQGQTDT